jgi:hypothetical protein
MHYGDTAANSNSNSSGSKVVCVRVCVCALSSIHYCSSGLIASIGKSYRVIQKQYDTVGSLGYLPLVTIVLLPVYLIILLPHLGTVGSLDRDLSLSFIYTECLATVGR